jgi:DnaJ family protein C protein 3
LVSTPEINILLSNILFYSLNDPTAALATIKKCIHEDPENKACKKEFRMLKNVSKHLTALQSHAQRKEWTQILTLLINENLLQEIQSGHTTLKSAKILHAKNLSRLLAQLEEWACEAYANTKSSKLALQHCTTALGLNPESIPALLAKSQILLNDEQYEAAIQLLSKANDVTGRNNHDIRAQLDKAQRLLRQSKKRDYYKILGVPRDANSKAIRKAYRDMSKKYHPDKYKGDLDEDTVSRKMAEINSAYEVLSNEGIPDRPLRFLCVVLTECARITDTV